MFWEFTQHFQPIAFLIYLIPLGIVLALMIRDLGKFSKCRIRQNKPLVLAVFLLLFGDTLHLSTMALRTVLPLLPASVSVMGNQLTWMEIGAFVTSLTLALFYMSLLGFIRRSMDQPRYGMEVSIMGALWIRIVLLFIPAGLAGLLPDTWHIIQNIPFFLGGIGISILFTQRAKQAAANSAKWMSAAGWSIMLSFVFYLVSLLVAGQESWMWVGMAAKSLCYLIMVVSLYQSQFVDYPHERKDTKIYLG